MERVGVHKAEFDGSNLASGVHVYRLKAGHFIQLLSCEVTRLLLVRTRFDSESREPLAHLTITRASSTFNWWVPGLPQSRERSDRVEGFDSCLPRRCSSGMGAQRIDDSGLTTDYCQVSCAFFLQPRHHVGVSLFPSPRTSFQFCLSIVLLTLILPLFRKVSALQSSYNWNQWGIL